MLSLSNYITEEINLNDRIHEEEEEMHIPLMFSNVENIREFADGSMKNSEAINKIVEECLTILKVEIPYLSDKEAYDMVMHVRKINRKN